MLVLLDVVGNTVVVVETQLLKVTTEGLRCQVVSEVGEELVGTDIVHNLLIVGRDVLKDVNEFFGDSAYSLVMLAVQW